MTTPIDPVDPGSESAVPAPDPGTAVVPDGSPTTQDLRELVAALVDQFVLKIDPVTVTKATVSAVVNTGTPTISVDFPAVPNSDGSPGTPVTADSIRYLDQYSPVVGDTVLLLKQKSAYTGLGQINDSGTGAANGWQTAGSASYRLVVDNGDQAVQLKGSYATGGNATLFTLPDGYRPTVARQFVAASDSTMGYSRIQVDTGGVVSIVNGTTLETTDATNIGATAAASPGSSDGSSASSTGSTGLTANASSSANSGTNSPFYTDWDARGSGAPATHYHGVQQGDPNNTTGHTHGISHNHTVDAHSHTMAHTHAHSATHTHTIAASNHTHTVTPALPTTVWFDDKSFFI